VIEGRAPPGGAALRISELVRDAARERALASLAPERAGLLVGMALGDTSLLPRELEGEFRAAGLTHLMAVSGANLAVVLAAGLWLAGLTGAGRRGLAAVGIVLVVVLVVVTRWEPSVLRAGVMAGLVLISVKLIRYHQHLETDNLDRGTGVGGTVNHTDLQGVIGPCSGPSPILDNTKARTQVARVPRSFKQLWGHPCHEPHRRLGSPRRHPRAVGRPAARRRPPRPGNGVVPRPRARMTATSSTPLPWPLPRVTTI
jgi:hypothetical protein